MTRLKDRNLRINYKQQLMREGNVLLEAADHNKVAEILKSLDNITPDGAAIFDKAIADAKLALQKYAQGGIKQFFKNIFDDPVSKTIALSTGIRGGISQIPAAIKPYLPKTTENNDVSIWELINDPQQQEQMLQTFIKLFTAPVLKSDIKNLASLVKKEQLPYVSDLKQAVTELLQNVSLDQVTQFAQQANNIPNPGLARTTVAPDTKRTQQDKQTQPAKPAQQAQQPVAQAEPNAADIANYLTSKDRINTPITDVQPAVIEKIVDILIKQKLLTTAPPPAPLAPANPPPPAGANAGKPPSA